MCPFFFRTRPNAGNIRFFARSFETDSVTPEVCLTDHCPPDWAKWIVGGHSGTLRVPTNNRTHKGRPPDLGRSRY